MLESRDKIILSVLYVCQIDGKSPIDIIKKKSMLSEDVINSKIDDLIKNQFVDEDRRTLTEFGRDSLCIVLAGGVFDIIHPGHIYTLNGSSIHFPNIFNASDSVKCNLPGMITVCGGFPKSFFFKLDILPEIIF